MAKTGGGVVVNLLATLMLLEIAALAALGGYVILTGKVTQEQVRLAYKVYTGDITEQLAADAESWKKHQEEEQRKARDTVKGPDATAKLAATSIDAEAARLGIERQFKELQDRQDLLQRRTEEYEQKRKSLEEIEKRIDEKAARERQGAGQESFQKLLSIIKGMKPPLIKEILLDMDDATAVQVLKGLDGRTGAKVIEEFKTPAELQRRTRLLDIIRAGEMAAADRPAGG